MYLLGQDQKTVGVVEEQERCLSTTICHLDREKVIHLKYSFAVFRHTYKEACLVFGKLVRSVEDLENLHRYATHTTCTFMLANAERFEA